jgi:hypothetical protein
MARRIGFSFLVLALAMLMFNVHSTLAVVRNDDGVGNPGDFPCAIKFGDRFGPMGADRFYCSGTVVGHGRYVITAKHCIISGINGGDYRIMNQAGATVSGQGVVFRHPTADIAIVCLRNPLPDWYPLYCGDPADKQVCFTGFGRSSDTNPGTPGNNTGGPGGPGTGNDELPYGTPRTGYNILDQMGGAIGADEVAFDFDLAGGVMDGVVLGNPEGTTFGGDSGMGYLVRGSDGQFRLAGVHSGILNMPGLNVDQSVSVGTSVPFYKGWIQSHIPEPGSWGLLCCAAIGWVAMRVGRRK